MCAKHKRAHQRFSFNMGIYSLPLKSYIPPNHSSALIYPHKVMPHIQKELSLGRYSGSFSQSELENLISPFQSSLIGTVLKYSGSLECRVIHDLSFPRDNPSLPSINSQINIDDFKCNWGTSNEVRSIMIDAPPLSEAATLNIDPILNCCPITPSQQPNFVIQWDSSFYVITMPHLGHQAQAESSAEWLMLNQPFWIQKAWVPYRQ